MALYPELSTQTEISTVSDLDCSASAVTVTEVSTQIEVSTVLEISTQIDVSTQIEVSTVLEVSTQVEVSTVVSEVVASCSTIEEEEEVNHCAGPPCGNGGTCFNLTVQYRCECPEGWTGTNCDTGMYLMTSGAQDK